MKKADNRHVGIGLTIRQVRDAINTIIDETVLDTPFVIEGKETGYDFLSYIGPAEQDLKIGHLEIALVKKGKPIAILQDGNID